METIAVFVNDARHAQQVLEPLDVSRGWSAYADFRDRFAKLWSTAS